MGTEAAAATAPETGTAPTAAVGESGDAFSDALNSIDATNDASDGAETTEQTGDTAGEQSEAEKPRGKRAKIDYEALFTEEKLSTPDGVKAARDALLELKRESGRKHVELSNREARLKEKIDAFRGERDRTQALTQMLTADLQALRTGKPDVALQALGRLAGADPLQLLEEINLNFAGGGQREETALVQELRSELAQLKQALQERDGREEHGRMQAFVIQRKTELLNAAADPARYPNLAELARQNPRGVADHIAEYITRSHQSGRRLDDATAIGHIEAELAEFRGRKPAAPNGDAGREPSALAKPESGQAPRPPGKTLTPSLATQNGGGRRPLTPDEVAQAQHIDPEELYAELFG